MKTRYIVITLLVFGLTLHIFAKQAGSLQEQSVQRLFLTGPSSLIVQQAIAGPCLGLGAESNILSVFSVYWSLKKKNLSEDDQQKAWRYIYQYLQNAQSFDPFFWDIYRLTNGLLAYQKNYQRRAIELLARGAKARAWDWEVPFIAGFLAHDLLKDDVLAFRLMKNAIHTDNAPPMILGLAAKFLAGTATVEDSIMFLRASKASLPKDYTPYIDKRIKKLLRESLEKHHENTRLHTD